MKKNSLAKQSKLPLDKLPIETDRPSYLSKVSPRGMEEADQRDMTLPRIAVCQAMTPQRKKNAPNFIQGLEEGQLFNTLTTEIYGEEIEVTPIFMFKSQIKFNPIDDGGGIDCQALNGKSGGRLHPTDCETCPFNQWGPDGDPPECLKFYNYVSLVKPKNELAVISLKSKAIKVAKQWNSLIKLRNADTFAGVYKIVVVTDTGAGQEFYNIAVKNAGWTDASTYKLGESYFNALKGKTIAVDMEGAAHDEEGESEL